MDLLDGPLKPPPPPGEPKSKADINAVYRPFEDVALNEQIKEECKEPELPQQQRVNEVLELLAKPTTTNAEQGSPAVEAKPPPVDLLDLSPTMTTGVDLLGEEAPVSAPSQPPAPTVSGLDDFDALMTSQTYVSCPRETPAPKSEPPANSTDLLSTDLLGDTSTTTPQVVSEPSAQNKTGGLDEFEAMLVQQPLIKSRLDSEEEMEKVMQQAKAQTEQRCVPSTLDLSTPARGEEWRDPVPGSTTEPTGVHAIVEQVKEVVSNVIPAGKCGAVVGEGSGGDGRVKTEGFGSDDLFPERRNFSITEEASEAWSKFVSVLPDQVRQHIEAPEPSSSSRQNEAPPSTNAASSSSSRTGPVSLAPPPPASSNPSFPQPEANAMGGSLAPMPNETALQAGHQQAAISRAYEGKWVPTYMRHQLAQGGHTTMPQGVNAHEYPADQPPPTVTNAFREMGQEVQENAQALLTYMVAILSSVYIQCQMCSQSAATTIHESTFADGQDDAQFGQWVDEADLGLGPMRSRQQRTIQGVTLETLLDIARNKLVLAPGEQIASNLPMPVRQLVKARELRRLDADSLIFSVEVNADALQQTMPAETVRLLGSEIGSEGAFGTQLLFQERWRLDSREAKACIDFSNECLQTSQVAVTIRTDIIERRDGGNLYCEVDSRLYTNPRVYGQHLPPGLVENLTQMHSGSTQMLHGAVWSLAQECNTSNPDRPNGASSNPTQVASVDTSASSPPPIVNVNNNWPASQKRPEKSGLTEKVQAKSGSDITLDKNLLLQVADGI